MTIGWISSQHVLASFKLRRFTTWWYFMVLNLMDFHPFNKNTLKQFHACCEPWSNPMEVRIPHQNSHKYAPSHASAAGVQESTKSLWTFPIWTSKTPWGSIWIWTPKQTFRSNTLKFSSGGIPLKKSRFLAPSWTQKTGRYTDPWDGWYTLGMATSQDSSDHQDYYIFSRESL